MQHKNTQTSSLLAIKKHVKSLPISLTQKSDLELVDIVNAQNPQSEAAKTIIIYRYLPKVLKDSKKIFNGQTRDYWHQDEIVQTGVKAILYAIRDFTKQEAEKKTPAFFTHITVLYISNYLNKKKISYDPLIQFNTIGTYTVTLTVTNTLGSDTETKTAYIIVTAPSGCDTLNWPPPGTLTVNVFPTTLLL